MHGVQQLGELVEPLPALPRVVGAFSYHLPQLLDVVCPHFFKCRLAFEAILWNCVEKYRYMNTKAVKTVLASSQVGWPRIFARLFTDGEVGCQISLNHNYK